MRYNIPQIAILSLIFITACNDMGNPVEPIVAIPVILNVEPDSAFVGDTVQINGTNFGTTRNTSTVTFGNVVATTYIEWTSIKIIVKVPVGASDSVKVNVTNKTSLRKYFKIIFPSSSPLISSVTPDSARTGDTLTINGSNFGNSQGTSTVSFGLITGVNIVLWNDSQIKVIVPSGLSPGLSILTLTVNNLTSNGINFNLLAPLISFANDITPIFNSKGCAGCHGGSGGLFVLPYSSLMAGTSLHGPVISPGDGEGSVIVKKLRGTAGFGSRMPQGGPFLSNSEIQKFVDWINQGAQNN